MKKTKKIKKANKRSQMPPRAETPKGKNPLSRLFDFGWFKKMVVGKGQGESLDLLDHWILKKRIPGFLS
jgi:hypothetical protein